MSSAASSAVLDKIENITNAAIALFFKREVYLVNLNYNKGWTFPGGLIDPGETSYNAAFREFDEETGTLGLRAWVESSYQKITKYMYGNKTYHTDIYVIQCNRKLPITFSIKNVKNNGGEPETVAGKLVIASVKSFSI